MTKTSQISWGSYDKGFYGIKLVIWIYMDVFENGN